MDNTPPDQYVVQLTYTQRKNLLEFLASHPLFQLADTLNERKSGDYALDRDQALAGVYALRLALQSESFQSGRRRRPLTTTLNQLETLLGIDVLE